MVVCQHNWTGRVATVFAFVIVGCLAFAAGMAHAQTWTQADKSDQLHGTSFREFSLQGKFLALPHQSSLTAPILVVHCQPGLHAHGNGKGWTNGHFVEGWIDTGAVVDSQVGDSGRVSVKVEFRLDAGKLQTDFWPISTDQSGVFITEQLPFCHDCILANLLYGHQLPHKEGKGDQVRKVLLGVPEYLGAEIEMQFDMPDASEIGEACGVIEHTK